MIATDCEKCCFFRQDKKDKGCSAQQMCVIKNGKAFAPGYCRLYRNDKWMKKQKTIALPDKILEENILKFDMLVFFDENINSIKDLERTLNSDWYIKYAQRIIIADTTGFGNRQNLALKYINSQKHSIPIVVDSSVINESIHQRGETIKRISKQVKSLFFMAIPAGTMFVNFDSFAQMIQNIPMRVIHWSFPFLVGQTLIVPDKLNCGLFLTEPYLAIMKLPNIESFTDQLRKEEKETGLGLSWLWCNINR